MGQKVAYIFHSLSFSHSQTFFRCLEREERAVLTITTTYNSRLALSHAFSLSLFRNFSKTLSRPLFLSLSFSLSLTHTHTLSLSPSTRAHFQAYWMKKESQYNLDQRQRELVTETREKVAAQD